MPVNKSILLLLTLWINLAMNASAGDNGPAVQERPGSVDPRISGLLAEADSAKKVGDFGKADSLALIAVSEARLSYESTGMLTALLFFIDLALDQGKLASIEDNVEEAEELLSRLDYVGLSCSAHISLAQYYLLTYNHEKALEHAYQALGVSEVIHDDSYKVRSHLILGRSLESGNRKMEAFRAYHSAMVLSTSLDDPGLMRFVYKALSRFYNFHKMYDQAVEYKLKEAKLVPYGPHGDSLARMNILYDLEGISLNSKGRVNLEAIDRIVEYAVKHGNEELKNSAQALMRTYFLNSGKIDELYAYYQEHPHFLQALREYNYLTYIRLMAVFKEHEGDTGRAMEFFREAESLISEHSNPILQSHFYLRYAEFLQRNMMLDSAEAKARMALYMSGEGDYLDYSLKATSLLEAICEEKEDFRSAHAFAVENRMIADSIREIARSEDLMAIELENATRLQEIEAAKKAAEKRRRHNIQYTAFTIGILSLFIILIMLGSFRVPKWVIQALGFFAFIFFFEFIILIADTEIHHMTHGEPWKILGIKVVLIAFLLPFHHWLEHRVVSYLIKKRLVNLSGFSLRRTIQGVWNSVFRH